VIFKGNISFSGEIGLAYHKDGVRVKKGIKTLTSKFYIPSLILIVTVIIGGSFSNAEVPIQEAIQDEQLAFPVADFAFYSNIAPLPLLRGPGECSWILEMPSRTSPDGALTVSDVITKSEYVIERLAFDVQMVGSGGLDRLDEYAVFASVQPYNTFEFGIRMSVSDGVVKGYTIYTPPGQDYVIREVDLLKNDGLRHHYEIVVQGDRVYFTVDGGPAKYIWGYSFGDDQYSLIATAHRTTDGWASEDFYMLFENPKYGYTK